jgi:hypothetical protein
MAIIRITEDYRVIPEQTLEEYTNELLGYVPIQGLDLEEL